MQLMRRGACAQQPRKGHSGAGKYGAGNGRRDHALVAVVEGLEHVIVEQDVAIEQSDHADEDRAAIRRDPGDGLTCSEPESLVENVEVPYARSDAERVSRSPRHGSP